MSLLRLRAVATTAALWLAAVWAVPAAAQQGGSVLGTVVDAATARPLAGAQVHIQGTGFGSLTNAQGRFQLVNVPAGTHELRVNMIGYSAATQEITVTAGQATTLTIQLTQSAVQLDELVVTALGVERERRSVPYSIAEVRAEDLTRAAPVSLTSAMYGKTTGVQIAQSASGPTGGANITIRGTSTITGNARPLVIVDGIPINDRASGYLPAGWEYERDWGSGLNNINPNDIESVQILKGASAAALYGSQAANGVVLIQTKRGRFSSGLGIEFNTAMTWDRVAHLPTFQNEFGAGAGYNFLIQGPNDGEFRTIDGVPYVQGTSISFGPRMRGQMVLWWDDVMRPFDPQPNNFRDLWDPGHNRVSSFAISNATERARYRLGYTRSDFAGVFPGYSQDANRLTLTGDLEVSSRLKTDFSLNYFNTNTVNPAPKWYLAFNMPRSVKTDLMREMYKTPEGYRLRPQDHPRLLFNDWRMMDEFFWTGYERQMDRGEDHLIGVLGTTLEINDWLNLRMRAGADLKHAAREDRNPSTQPVALGASGGYEVVNERERVNYGEVMLTADRSLTDDLGVNLLLGAATTRAEARETMVRTDGGLVVENWFSIGNSRNTPQRNAWRGMEQTDGVFGRAEFNFRDYLYVTATGRNDWTSTLPPGSNSYFYPSLGASFVFSEATQLPALISHGLVRANYAEVGRGARRYQANNVYEYDTWDGVMRNRFSSIVPPADLKPERTKELEFGLEMGFLQGRLGFDAAFYRQRNVDQIIDLGVAHSSGATNITVNQGEMRNTGLEVALHAVPIATRDFQWNTTFNFSRNRNEVVSLAAGLERLMLANIEDNLFIEARPGKPFGEIYGFDFRYAPDGQKIVTAGGTYAKSDTLSRVGNTQPDWIGGLINQVRFRDFTLTGVIDMSFGGDFISLTNYYGYYTGRWPETLAGRDEEYGGLPYWLGPGNQRIPVSEQAPPAGTQVWHDGQILPGVQEIRDENGNVSYAPNDVLVPTWMYYITNYAWKGNGIYPQAIWDNSYVKLREMSLSYRLPGAFATRMGVQDMQLSLIGRNLAFLHKNLPNIDPEASLNTEQRFQGYQDYHAYYPSTRSFGFGINARF